MSTRALSQAEHQDEPHSGAYDVVIVGGGPAGAVAAEAAAKRSLRVAVVERELELGKKLCAGAVPAIAWKELEIEDRLSDCRIAALAAYDADVGSWSFDTVDWGVTVQRTNFDSYLAHRAEAAGARLFLGCACTDVTTRRGRRCVNVVSGGRALALAADIVIFADGCNTLAARIGSTFLPFNQTEVTVAAQTNVFCRTRNVEDEQTLRFVFDRQLSAISYGWCFPNRHGFSVGIGSLLCHARDGKPVASLKRMLHTYGPLRQVLGQVESIGTIRCACIPARPRNEICDDGVMLVGDAAGQVSPLWGEGISNAMRAGQLAGNVAAGAIAAGDTSRDRLLEYETLWREAGGERLNSERKKLELALLASTAPVRHVAHSPRFASFGPFAEIAMQFANLRYPISDRDELVSKCGGMGRTFLFGGQILRLGPGLTRLPDEIFPLQSWTDAAAKMLQMLGRGTY